MTEDKSDRPRGFLTEKDREFLTTPTEELDVQQQTIRKRQDRIRERAYNAILDFELLMNLEHRQRDRLFRNVRDHWEEDYSAIRSMLEFTYLGLLEQGLAGGFPSLFEMSVISATGQYARDHGQFLTVDVECTIEANYQFDRDDPPEPNEEEVENSLVDEMLSAPEGDSDSSDHTPLEEALLGDDDTPYVERFRPENHSGEWDPTEDEALHEFIAAYEMVSSEDTGAIFGGRWEQLKKAAEFDPAEWGLEEEDNNSSDSHDDVENR